MVGAEADAAPIPELALPGRYVVDCPLVLLALPNLLL